MFTTTQNTSSLRYDLPQSHSANPAFNSRSDWEQSNSMSHTSAFRSASSWLPEQIPFSTTSVSSALNWPDVRPKVDLFAQGQFVDNAGSDFLGDHSNFFDDIKLYAGSELRFNSPPLLSNSAETIQINHQTRLGNFAQNSLSSPVLKIVDEILQIQLPSASAVQANFLANPTRIQEISPYGLNFSGEDFLSDRMIIVENGDINFNTPVALKNVTLIAKNGTVNLGDLQGENVQVWAAHSIHMNQGARFAGDNLLVTGQGDVIWNGATQTMEEGDLVKIIASGNIFWNSTATTRAELWASGNFIANQASEVQGSVYVQGDIILNAKMKFAGEWGRASETIATAVQQTKDIAQFLDTNISGLSETIADQFSEAELNQMELDLTRLFNQLPSETLLANPLFGDALINYADAFPQDFIPEQFPTGIPVPDPVSSFNLTGFEPLPIWPELPQNNQPLIGLIDTGIHAGNPQIDYNRLILGRDYTDNDANPLLPPKSTLSSEDDYDDHGTQMLEIIAAKRDGIGTEGWNPNAPIWVSRSVDSGDWTLAVRDFVQVVKQRNLPNGVLNLSFDLLGIPANVDPKGEPITRPYLTRYEYHALKYAQENGVLIVVSAGNEGENRLTALARATRYLDNVLVVGAASGDRRAGYSNYGKGLGLLTDGSGVAGNEEDLDSPPAEGTSAASARVAAVAAHIWAANPNLTYRQVMDILQATARDMGVAGWDEETGAGLLDADAAIAAASTWTQPASQLETEKTVEDLIDDVTVWATTYQRPNGRCWRKFWKKLRRVFKRVLKIASKIIGFVLKNIGTIATIFTGVGGLLGGLASKVLTGTVFRVVTGIAFVLTKVGDKLNKLSTTKTFENIKKVYEGITALTSVFKGLFKKSKKQVS
jgi:Subtilase family